MSNIRVQGNPSGSGTLTIASPNTNSDFTLNLPANAGTVPVLTSVNNNSVVFINSSGQATSGSALTFNGNVLGVNTTTPYFDLYATTQAANEKWWRLGSGSSNFAIVSINDAGTNSDTPYSITKSGYLSTAHIWGIGASEQMRLTSTGLGIGTSTPDVLGLGYGEVLGISSASSVGLEMNAAFGSTSNIDMSVNGTRRFQAEVGNSAVTLKTRGAVPLLFGTDNTERMRLDTSGNLGLGVTPSAWSTNFGIKAFDISGGSFYGANTDINVVLNGFFNSSNAWIYKTTNPASRYTQGSGQHQWFTAPSGTAGNAISFTQAMTLDASGNLGIGGSSAGNRLYVQRAAGADFRGETYLTDGSQWLIQNSNTSAGSYSTIVQANDASIIYSSGTTNNGAFTIAQWSSSQRGIRIDATGNFQFNSGYGAVATAFGCRAWVNFNGSNGTIRASGNVSSVTKNGTGDYTVNFTNAMPDANFSAYAMNMDGGDGFRGYGVIGRAYTSTTFRFIVITPGNVYADPSTLGVAIFR